jgi:hypothetical protein
MAIGPHRGKDVDEVPLSFLTWLLNAAELRPGPDEEIDLREAAGEVGGGVVRAAKAEWTNVVVGHRSFSIPPELARLFDEEMQRLQQLFPPEWQAFEAMIAGSSQTPLESMQ